MSNANLNSPEAKTQAEVILRMAELIFPPKHPEVLFARWLVDNAGGLRRACLELGVTPPEDGPRLINRLKDAVTPVLVQRDKLGEV